MKKREAQFQTIFNQYLRKKKLFGYFELKQARYGSLAFNAVKKHQIEGLRSARMSGFVWKLSDEDSREKPFDCISVPPLMSYVVVNYTRRFYIITIYDFMAEMDSSERESLTEERAKKISTVAVSW